VAHPIPALMTAAVLTCHGGYDVIEVREDVPVPVVERGEVLIRVGAAAVNNTDINTRIGWYSRAVSEGTTVDGADAGIRAADAADATWGRVPLSFPRIQGADVCGRIAAVGSPADAARVGERVLVEPCLRAPVDWAPNAFWYLGSECDGGFAEYVKVHGVHAHRVETELDDAELASFPCSYSTAENLLTRVAVKAGELPAAWAPPRCNSHGAAGHG
jgi:NADPH:quinone reductase-like Zn-dependent oxidoreductase